MSPLPPNDEINLASPMPATQAGTRDALLSTCIEYIFLQYLNINTYVVQMQYAYLECTRSIVDKESA